LSQYARQALRRMRKRPTLVIAFWRQTELFPLYLYYAILNRCLLLFYESHDFLLMAIR